MWLLDIISAYDITRPEAIEEFISAVFKTEHYCKQFVEHVKQHGEVTHETTSQGEFRKDVPLRTLKNAVDTLEDCMRPLEGCIEEMVFFHSRESLLFKEHMQLSLGDGSRQLTFEVKMLSNVCVCVGGGGGGYPYGHQCSQLLQPFMHLILWPLQEV